VNLSVFKVTVSCREVRVFATSGDDAVIAAKEYISKISPGSDLELSELECLAVVHIVSDSAKVALAAPPPTPKAEP
jgi:hypothetical protein